MKKYVFLYHGFGDPTRSTMDAWARWFTEIGGSIVDSGNPFGPGRRVTPTGSHDLATGGDAITGYTIVNAESMEAAEKLLAGCPMATAVSVYEAMPM
jgi:hypothetical protein